MISILIAACLFSAAAPADYAAGQIWSYDTRPRETDSRLYIVQPDTTRDGNAVSHVSIDNLSIQTSMGVLPQMVHVVVSGDALGASGLKLVAENATRPNIDDSIAAWQASAVDGRVNVFDLPLRNLIDFAERSMAHVERE